MAAARLLIQLLDGDTVVHEYSRSTSQPCAESIQKLLGGGMGWMQSYYAAINDQQWQHDVARAEQLQP